MSTWDEDFSDFCDEWAEQMPDDIRFYVELAGEADGPIVELAARSPRRRRAIGRQTYNGAHSEAP